MRNIKKIFEDGTSRSGISKEKAIELYGLFDEIHVRLIRATGIKARLGRLNDLIAAIDEANEYASQMEEIWATVLTLEDRATGSE